MRYLVVWFLTLCGFAVLACADQILDVPKPKPETHEQCVNRCDMGNDLCMEKTEGDRGQMMKCDRYWGYCLAACQRLPPLPA